MKRTEKQKLRLCLKSRAAVLSMAMIGVVYLLIFAYIPMIGLLLGFKDGDYLYSFWDALASDWVGLSHFERFLTDMDFKSVFFNTIGLNFLCLLFNFPAPILFAVLINEVSNKCLKKTFQSVTYLPHF